MCETFTLSCRASQWIEKVVFVFFF